MYIFNMYVIYVIYAIVHPQVHTKAVLIFSSLSTPVLGDVSSSLQWVRGRKRREMVFFFLILDDVGSRKV